MKIGFDLDGTLDNPALRQLAANLLMFTDYEVHIITGCFPGEGGEWQSPAQKRAKVMRLNLPFTMEDEQPKDMCAILHILMGLPITKDRDVEYVLRDLGLRKGDLCQRLGIDLFLDDSDTYCNLIPKMDGHVTVLQVL